jgi:hypothetical protein
MTDNKLMTCTKTRGTLRCFTLYLSVDLSLSAPAWRTRTRGGLALF